MALLTVNDIHTFYGNIEALKGISIEVEEGEVVTLIGSNGAGKSTTLRSISGLTPPRTGTIHFDGNDISATPPQDVVALGISQALPAHDRTREPRAGRLPAARPG
jgi:branched-chain amino acid transport system ATP-binding protein